MTTKRSESNDTAQLAHRVHPRNCMRGWLTWLIYLLLVMQVQANELPVSETEQTCWIWTGKPQQDEKHLLFRRQINLKQAGSGARLRFAPCFTHLTVRLNGNVIGIATPYQTLTEIDLPDRIAPGKHSLSVEAIGVDGPSAFFIELAIARPNQPDLLVRSDAQWTQTTQQYADQLLQQNDNFTPAQNLGPIENAFRVPADRRVGIDALDNYEQWKQAFQAESEEAPASFMISPGFQIRRVQQTVPSDPDTGSWVSMTVDPEGRLIVAREDAGLVRMTLSKDGKAIEKTEMINDDLKECRGLTFRGRELFVNANNSKGLYRLRPEGDGFGEPELLFASSGGVGHGRNDLTVGPDQMLYSIHGDSVDLPNTDTDYTSPYREARQDVKTSEGHLLRINPDDRSVAIVAAGLRNPFGLDFNQHGECFTYDADAEYDMGAPWYRPTRILHLTTGGDFGWRGVTKSWPAYYPDHPDNAVPNLDIGKGSPTTVKFGTRSNFPERYRQGLFVLDWAYGRVLLVNLLPRGSSYAMTSETFLKGRPLNVTDLEFAADGSLYLITGGRKTQSALYRVSYIGDQPPTQKATDHTLRCREYSLQSRELRRTLESQLTREISNEEFDQAWQQLRNPDPWISHAAARVIERIPTSKWEQRALRESDTGTAVRAITCLIRSQKCKDPEQAILRLTELAQQTDHASDQRHALYACWLAIPQLKQRTSALDRKIANLLADLYPAGMDATTYEQNRLLSELLVLLGDNQVVKKTIRLLQQTTIPEQRLHYLYVLRNATNGWTPALRRTYFVALSQCSKELGGAGLPEFIRRIQEDSLSHLDLEDKNEIEALLNASQQATQAEIPTMLAQRPLIQEWTVEQIMSGPKLTGDRKRGETVFASAGCVHCHRFGTRGNMIGPDLTAAMGRYSRRDLLSSVVNPSHVIAENYRGIQIVTEDGRVLTGQVTRGGDYRSPILRLATDPTRPSKTVEVAKSEITSRKNSDVSWMPDGLLNSFSRQQIFDLIAYLESSR